MRVPVPSEPNLSITFPTYQVPQVSAMRGRAPPVQVARASWGGRADPPSTQCGAHAGATLSVISGSSCLHPVADVATPSPPPPTTPQQQKQQQQKQQQQSQTKHQKHQQNKATVTATTSQQQDDGNSNLTVKQMMMQKKNNNSNNSNDIRRMVMMMQSVTDNCLLSSNSTTTATITTVTVPNKQRNNDGGRLQQMAPRVAHNNIINKHNNINKINNNDNIINSNNTTTVTTTNRDKLASKFGALLLLHGQDIPNQKADDLEDFDDDELMNLTGVATAATTVNSSTTTIEYLFLNDGDYKTPTSTNTKVATAATPSDITRDDEDDEQRTSRAYAPPLRLRGGGESSISTGTTGWGTPPSQQASNNNGNSTGWGSTNATNQNNTGTQQWNNNSNRPPTSGPGNSQDSNKTNSNISQNGQQPPASQQSNNSGWGQPGNKQQPGVPPTSIANNSTSNANTNNAQGQPTNTTKQQLEQLTNMREAIFSHDGWGGQHVNQDTNWDIPGSPEPQLKMDGSGAPAWKPAVNNGTELWEANLRNGGQPPPQPQQKAPWGHTPSTNIGGTWGEDDDVTDSSNVWTGVPPAQPQWGSGNAGNGGTTAMWGGKSDIAGPKKENDWGTGAANTGWGDPRSADPRNTSIDPRDMRPDPTHIRTPTTDPMRMLDPREQMRLVGGDMRGDPRGITGRLNGAGAEAFWGQAGPQAGGHHMHQPKMPMGPGNTTGWEEPSPPSQRRNMPNYDDGTSLWGNPQPGSHWKDLPTGASMGRNSAAGPPGMQSRMKPEASVWGHGRNGSWDDAGPGWDETGPWPKQKTMPGPIWENDGDWIHKQGPKQAFTKEMIWNSKQFRVLVEMGYKKEDVENALRNREMNIEEAVDMLGSRNPNLVDSWRGRHEDHYEHQQFSGQRFPTGPTAQMNFPPGGNAPNLLNNINSSSAGANNSLINNMSPAIVHKMLSQSNASQGFGGGNPAGGRSSLQAQTTQPSTAQLKMLVQQIQMAVQAGYLNHQILNQPLAPQTLVLLNQLLQQIKNLQQLANQQAIAQNQPCLGMKPNNNHILQYNVVITKTKQQISNLQNQIAAQQAMYVKQQHMGSGGPSDLFKSNSMHDSINALQSNFADIGIKDTQMSQQQSRLNQWKLPALDKEEGGEFSRAPGSVSKSLAPSHSSPNLNPLGLTQPDGPWSSGRSADTGWPDSGAGDSGAPDVKDAQWAAPTQPSLTDLVPEFEPGKPWKGTQIKSIEDDPSITPGSVVRSPLSIATIKDNELFNMNPNKSPPLGDSIQPLSLSSSTWSFNPPSSTSTMISSFFHSSPQNKLPTTKGTLGDLNTPTAVTSELWGAPKPRGPPPGLSAKSSVVNGWVTNLGSNTTSWGGQRNWAPGGGSPWLLLRNLTAQIDGSTLRTLCVQHGPLQSFHLYLHQGFALIKYSSREEATKAQQALNNCVLGNTTILAENPTEWEAGLHLQQVASQQSASSGTWRGSGKQQVSAADNTWSTGWPNTSSTSLWGSTPLDSGDQSRATPSSLNSFLPGDLLGGESM